MRILVLGGDGYLGWPTAMHLTARGHDVAVVDNYLRRRLCREENVEPLFEVPNLEERAGTTQLMKASGMGICIRLPHPCIYRGSKGLEVCGGSFPNLHS